MVSSDSGALEQVVHQVLPTLFFVIHAGRGPRSISACSLSKREPVFESGPNLQTEPMKYID